MAWANDVQKLEMDRAAVAVVVFVFVTEPLPPRFNVPQTTYQ